MKKRIVGIGLLAALGLLGGPRVEAGETTGTGTTKARKAKAPKPPTDKGPAETRSERDKRLLRECRGRPNAGACEGYASLGKP